MSIKTHSKNSLYLFRLGSSEPLFQTYDAAATANINKNKMKPKVSLLFAVTRLTPNNIVLNNFPCDVLKPVLMTYATQPLSCGLKPVTVFDGAVC